MFCCDCEIFWLTAGSCDGICLIVYWVGLGLGVGVGGGGGGGGGWAHHMGLGEEFKLGEVNAHGATNKQ